MNICLIGVDGVGKTTHGKLIKKYLEMKGRSAVYKHTSRFRFSLLLPALMVQNFILRRDGIFDRSYYDFIIEVLPEKLIKNTKLTKYLINTFIWIFPKYDVILWLVASFREVDVRKNEVTRKQYDKRTKLYKMMVNKLDIKIVSTEKPIEQVSSEIIKILNFYI